MVSWTANPEAVITPAIKQVEDKMQLFEGRAASYTSKLNSALEQIGSLTLEDIGDAPALELAVDFDLITPPSAPELNIELREPILDLGGIEPIEKIDTALQTPDFNSTIKPPVFQDVDTTYTPIKPVEIALPDEISVSSKIDAIAPMVVDVGDIQPIKKADVQPLPNIDTNITPLVFQSAGFDVSEVDADFSYQLSDLSLPNVPDAPIESVDLTVSDGVRSVDISEMLNALDLNGLDDFPDVPFESVPVDFSMNLPELANVALPNKPDIDTKLELPDVPTIDMPELEALEKLVIPDFSYDDIEDFDGKPPEFNIAIPENIEALVADAVAVASEDYYAKNKDSAIKPLVLEIKSWLEGSNPSLGLPIAIEQSLFNRARERTSRETERAVQEALTDWASRGFSMPQGMLAKQVNDIRDQGKLAIADLNRDILIQSFDKQLEHIRFLTEQGMALEKMKQDMWLAYVSNMLEAAKFQVDSKISIFNAQVNLFNAQNAAFEMLISVYKTKIEGAIAKLSAYKAKIDAQLAIGQVNQQRIDVFKGKIELVTANVDVYKAMIQAGSVRADMVKNVVDMYRTEIQAYSEGLSADGRKIELYKAQVDAETAKIGGYEALSRNYATQVQAVSVKNDSKFKKQDAHMEAARIRLQEFNAKLDADKNLISNKLAIAQNNTNNYARQIEYVKALTQYRMSEADVEIKSLDAAQRTAIANADLISKNVDNKVRVELAKLDAQSKQVDIESRVKLGNLDAQIKYADMVSRNNISNAELDAKYMDLDLRAKMAKVDADTKVMEANVRIATANADLQAKQMDSQVRIAIANNESFTRIATTNADIASKAMEANARMASANLDLQAKQVDIESRIAIANMDAHTKYAEMTNRANISNVEMQARVGEANSRIKIANADMQARFVDMQSRVAIANAETQSRYMDMVSRTNISNADVQARMAEAKSRVSIAKAEMEIKAFDSKSQRSFQKTQLALECAKAVGQYTAQLAAGALSAMHVSAGISASGSVGLSSSTSESESTSHNYSY